MTRLRTPRIPPLPPEEWDDDTRQLLTSLKREGRIFNIFATLARHPALLRRWLVFGTHILGKSTLPPRERELAILRMGWLCRAEYEWGHHVAIGKDAGLTEAEIQRVAQGADASGWEPFERTLLRAVDELHQDTFISDPTWQSLAARYNTQQLLDLVFTAGQYKLVCIGAEFRWSATGAGIRGIASGRCMNSPAYSSATDFLPQIHAEKPETGNLISYQRSSAFICGE